MSRFNFVITHLGRRLLVGAIAVCGLLAAAPASATEPAALVPLPQRMLMRTLPSGSPVLDTGRVHGYVTGDLLRLTRLNPVVRLNPPLNTASHPLTAAQIAATFAQYQQGRALGAFMVGNQPLGTARQIQSRYLSGLATGITQ